MVFKKLKFTYRLKLKYVKNGILIFGIAKILVGLAIIPLLIYLTSEIKSLLIETNTLTQNIKMLPRWQETLTSNGLGMVSGVWLGIASIQGKRWARTLLLALSWDSLANGLIYIFSKIISNLFIDNPESLQSGKMGFHEMYNIIRWFPIGLIFVFSIILPLVMVLFYGDKNVKKYFESKDATIPWTDRVPLLVLILFVQTASSGISSFLSFPFSPSNKEMFFGIQLSNIYFLLYKNLNILFLLYLSWIIYRQKNYAWWLLIWNFLFFRLAWIVGYSEENLLNVGESYGASDELTKKLLKGRFFGYLLNDWIIFIAYFAFYLYVRKYFFLPKFNKNPKSIKGNSIKSFWANRVRELMP